MRRHETARAPWGPDDWDAWWLALEDEDPPAPAEDAAIAEVLEGLPGRRRMNVADLGCGRGKWLPFLAARFGRVVAIDYAPHTIAVARRAHGGARIIFRRRDLRDLTPFRRTLHVALLLDALVGPRVSDVDQVLGQVHDTLLEGGLLIATLPAAPRRGGPVAMRLATEDPAAGPLRFTEVDAQYRLRRAGFQGARIRRFSGGRTRPDRLLCLATRRANN